MDFSNLRINCTRIGKIFTKNKDCITEKELLRIDTLIAKERLGKITDLELERLDFLANKREESSPHIIGVGAQMYLLYIYALKKYGLPVKLFAEGSIHASAANGILKEPYSIELISRIYNKRLYRNKQTIKNDKLLGVIDAWDCPDWKDSDCVHEIKTTSDIRKFLIRKRYPLSKDTFLQMQGYLALTDKNIAEVNFCLVDFPESVIESQNDALFRYLCPDGIFTGQFEEEWAKMENKLRFVDVPDRDRIFTCIVDRNEEVIEKIYKRVDDCRKWLKEFKEFDDGINQGRYVDANKIRF